MWSEWLWVRVPSITLEDEDHRADISEKLHRYVVTQDPKDKEVLLASLRPEDSNADKEYVERVIKREVESGKSPGPWIKLARFFYKQGLGFDEGFLSTESEDKNGNADNALMKIFMGLDPETRRVLYDAAGLDDEERGRFGAHLNDAAWLEDMKEREKSLPKRIKGNIRDIIGGLKYEFGDREDEY